MLKSHYYFLMKVQVKLHKSREPNKRFNFDSWAFAATLLLAASCFSGIH